MKGCTSFGTANRYAIHRSIIQTCQQMPMVAVPAVRSLAMTNVLLQSKSYVSLSRHLGHPKLLSQKHSYNHMFTTLHTPNHLFEEKKELNDSIDKRNLTITETHSQLFPNSSSSSNEHNEQRESNHESSANAKNKSLLGLFFGFFRHVFRLYSAQLAKRPFLVQSLTSGTLFMLGDITSQNYEAYLYEERQDLKRQTSGDLFDLRVQVHDQHAHHIHTSTETDLPPEFSIRRLMACSSFGFFLMGPIGHWWYTELDLYVRRKMPHLGVTSLKFVVTKVALDTVLFNPIFLALFFSSVSIVEGLSVKEIGNKLVRDFVPSYAVDCSVWPLIQTFNFRFVPVHFQLLVVNLFCYCDDVFLSYVQHNGMPGIFKQIEKSWLSFLKTHNYDFDESAHM